MDLILDTCGLLSLSGLAQKKLSKQTLSAIQNAATVYVSACSLFEISLKVKRERLNLFDFDSPESYWLACIERYQLDELPVDAKDFDRSVQLPDHHADPFDRIIIAQSERLACPIVTYDSVFEQYGVQTLK